MLMKGPKGRLEYKPNMKAHIGGWKGRGGRETGTLIWASVAVESVER